MWMIPLYKLYEEQRYLIDEWLPSLTEGEIVLVQEYDTSVILHSIPNLYRIHENVSIVILVPNNLLIKLLAVSSISLKEIYFWNNLADIFDSEI